MARESVVTLDKRSKAIQQRHAAMQNLQEGRQGISRFFSNGISTIFGTAGLAGVAVAPIYVPFLMPLLGGLIAYGYYKQKKSGREYPLYTPLTSEAKVDPRDIDPATRKPRAPRGSIYLGVEPTTMRQVWTTFDVEKQHKFVQATTGGGKTETLIGYCANYLAFGSGFIFIDGKAAMELSAKVAAMCHRTMSIDDMYFINYITGNKSPWGKTESEMSSTVNPFLTGSYSSLAELIKSLLQDDGDIWAKRAQSFVDALTRVLVYLRDKGELKLNISHFSEYLQLEELGRLAGRTDIPKKIRRELFNFVKTLPGLDAEGFTKLLNGEPLDPRKSTQPLDQLGYITMQLTPVLNILSGDYGYIFDVLHGNINVRDIVLKRRILVVLIPALEKAAPSLRSLGQVVIALVRDLVASGIGNQLEGNIDLALKRRFTDDITPYALDCDEAGSYWIENAFAPLWAQSRSIGIACTMGSQDNFAMEKVGEAAAKELKTVTSNSNTKVIGKLEIDRDNMSHILKRLSESTVYQAKRLSRNYGGLSSNSYYTNEVEAEQKTTIDAEDFYALREGEYYYIHQDIEVRVDTFAVFPKWLREQRSNTLVPPGDLPKKRSELLIDSHNTMRRRYILSERIENKQKKHTSNRKLEQFSAMLPDTPDLKTAFSAMSSYQQDRRASFTKTLDELTAKLTKARTVQTVTDKEAQQAQERAARKAESLSVEFESEQDAAALNEQNLVNAGLDGEMASPDEASALFHEVFGDPDTMLYDLTVINMKEAHRQGNDTREDRAQAHAELTVKRIDEVMTSYPTPPVPNVDSQSFVSTLEKIQKLLSRQ